MAYGVYVTIAEDAGTELFVESVTGFVGLPKGFAATPFNRLTIPVTSENVSPFEQLIDEAIFFRQSGSLHINDYCDDNSILFDDGICYPLLRQGPCPDHHQWLTIDPITLRV